MINDVFPPYGIPAFVKTKNGEELYGWMSHLTSVGPLLGHEVVFVPENQKKVIFMKDIEKWKESSDIGFDYEKSWHESPRTNH